MGRNKNKLFKSYCEDNGILHQFTVPYSPQQNGIAERLNQNLLNSIRSMLPQALRLLSTAPEIKNRSPSAAIKTNKTPLEMI
jgi:transposase InsO family protein